MSTKIKYAVIGFGYIGRRHAEIISGHPDCEIVAACDVKADRNADAIKYDIPFFSTPEEMLSSGIEMDVVCICTPNGLHARNAVLALEHGNHVVIEKPLGLTKAESEKVLFTSLRQRKYVFCVMQNRYSPPSEWLKEVMTQKLLGDIHMVEINCFWNRDDRYYGKSDWKGTMKYDGGPLFTQFSHFMDIMVWLFGDVKNIRAQFKNYNHHHNTEFEDSGYVSFEFLEGGIGSLNYSTSTWDKNFESSMVILGEKGTIKVGGQYMENVEYCHIENYEMPELAPSNPPNDYGVYKGSAANHHYVFENVVDTLRGNSFITTNGMEGLKVVEIIEKIYEQRDLSVVGGTIENTDRLTLDV